MTVVMDANALIYALMGQKSDKELIVKNHIIAPELIFPEAANVLRKYESMGVFGRNVERKVTELLQVGYTFVDQVHPHDSDLMSRALAHSIASGHSTYEWVYLELAKKYSGYLLTYDKKLRKLASHEGVVCFPANTEVEG
ncbi:type II toxin-antitoxin system VapC family toxin [Salinispira pacifica]|uniref:PIN domain-containing protein n=1 Tax=Salinispira pacifica TaxID=1307761 RepID=V5WE87_9SPIO|nr:type II toxin-antitoxin system VapC family toxin [Salinispira pacifica]AHC14113.1 hypothetical protein L21SP2_0686 [Salinispira pacifica]